MSSSYPNPPTTEPRRIPPTDNALPPWLVQILPFLTKDTTGRAGPPTETHHHMERIEMTKPRLFLGIFALALLLPLLLLACGGSDEPTDGTSQGGVAPSLQEQRDRANSDDAESIDEVQFHAMARAAVILNVEPNQLGVGGREFRVKRNPTAPGGAFIYDPHDKFQGVERNLVWWVPSGDIGALIAYPLNSPSQLVTPGSEFPGRAGLAEFPNTPDVVAYVFRGESMP